jgi:hypothetical protein
MCRFLEYLEFLEKVARIWYQYLVSKVVVDGGSFISAVYSISFPVMG